jgi:hypothetical protein
VHVHLPAGCNTSAPQVCVLCGSSSMPSSPILLWQNRKIKIIIKCNGHHLNTSGSLT